jgi:hypothetical protein
MYVPVFMDALKAEAALEGRMCVQGLGRIEREKEYEGVVKNGKEEKEKVVVMKKVKEKEEEKETEVMVGSRGEDREERGSSGGEDGNEETKR